MQVTCKHSTWFKGMENSLILAPTGVAETSPADTKGQWHTPGAQGTKVQAKDMNLLDITI